MRIETLVLRRREYRHVRMLLLDLRDPLGRGDEIEEDDALVAELLQLRERIAPPVASIGSITIASSSFFAGGTFA